MSLWQLTFAGRIDYSAYDDLLFAVTISSDFAAQVVVRVKLDTGSTFCVFQRRYADLLGLDVEGGLPQRIRTATGSFTAYGHEITLTIGELEWQAVM